MYIVDCKLLQDPGKSFTKHQKKEKLRIEAAEKAIHYSWSGTGKDGSSFNRQLDSICFSLSIRFPLASMTPFDPIQFNFAEYRRNTMWTPLLANCKHYGAYSASRIFCIWSPEGGI
jgi:hypothetical protein